MKHLVVPFILTVVTACSRSERSVEGPALTISVAPLELPGVGDACYGLTVRNGDGDEVWARTGLCSSRFGNARGDLAFVGPCDASAANHTVELVLEGLSDTEGAPLSDFVNPAPTGQPLVLGATCTPNGDTPVVFNLTIMRRAQQGFFDVAVNFDDLFCSAKLDCEAGNLLYDPRDPTGPRRPTAVVGLACTGGLGADTHLYWRELVLDCGDDLVIPLGGPAGNLWSASSPAPAPLVQGAVYRGIEALSQGGTSFGKVYTNVALAPDLTSGLTCTLRGMATASDGPLAGCETPDATAWPVIRIDQAFIGPAGFTCGRHPLDQTPGSGVFTDYTTLAGTPMAFATHAEDGAAVVTSCAPGGDEPVCGNGVIEDEELCDGDVVPGSCVDLGFTGGVLTCSGDCGYVTTGCVSQFCGNGVIEDEELCDGDLVPDTCADLGFTGGVLTCSGDCGYDTTGCTNCVSTGLSESVCNDVDDDCDGAVDEEASGCCSSHDECGGAGHYCDCLGRCSTIEEAFDAMVLIPAAGATVGCDEGVDESCAAPNRLVGARQVSSTPSFSIDVYEARASDVAAFLNARTPACPAVGVQCYHIDLYNDELGSGRGAIRRTGTGLDPIYVVAPGHEDHAAAGLSWHGANAYCAWRGKRACTSEEIEVAQRGPLGSTYPWGEEPPSCAKTVGRGCGFTTSGYTSPFYPGPVDAKLTDVSCYGVVHLAGNATEHTSTVWPQGTNPYVSRGGNAGMSFDGGFSVFWLGWYQTLGGRHQLGPYGGARCCDDP